MDAVESMEDAIKRIKETLAKNEKEKTELKEDKEKIEKLLKKQIEELEKDRTQLILRNSELEATLNNKNREHEAECKRLNETINKGTQQLNQYCTGYTRSVTEISRLNAEVHKLKLENQDLQTFRNIYPDLKQQITSLRKTIQDLENQKEDLMLKIDGSDLYYLNPNIPDLSDEKRPTKLAQEFSELYDNEWTDAFEEVEAVDDKSRIKFLFDVLKRASEYCTDLSTGHDAAIKSSFTTLKYEVTVPITEDSEPDKDTPNDTTETTMPGENEKQHQDKDTPNGTTDSTTADKVDKQEYDEGLLKNSTEAVQMDNDDDQEHDKTNNDLSSDDKLQNDDKQENKEDDDFVHVDEATDTESNEATNAMYATLEVENATNDSKPKDDVADTYLPTNNQAKAVDNYNGSASCTSVDKENNSGPHDKNAKGAHGDWKETNVNIKSQSEENNENTTGSPRENKQPTTKTIEISKVDFNFDALSKEQLKIIMDLKKSLEIQQSDDVKSNGAKIIAAAMNVKGESVEMWKYILKCIDICWSMHRHDPPVHINFTSHVDGEPFDKDVYRPYIKSGKQLDFVVWPSLHLHKDGPMLRKGFAQGKTCP